MEFEAVICYNTSRAASEGIFPPMIDLNADRLGIWTGLFMKGF